MSPFLSIENLERQASQVLHDAGFDGELPVDPIEIAKTMGLSVHLAKFSDENTAGILRIDGENASIFVRSTDSPNRQRFTVAHELGHYVLHRREESDFVDTDISVAFLRRSDGDSESDRARRRRETQANLFAAALLMPEYLLSQELENDDDVSKLANLFGVSRGALGIRLAAIEEIG